MKIKGTDGRGDCTLSQHDRDLGAEQCRRDFWHSALLAGALFVGFGIGAWFLVYDKVPGLPRPISKIDSVLIWPALFLVVAAIVGPAAVIFAQRARARRVGQSQQELAALRLATCDVGDKALGRLVAFNFQLLDRFVEVALGQARAAYIFCLIAASVSLMVLLGGTAAVMVAPGTGAQIAIGTLTGVGALLSGFISATFQKQYAAATQQMSFYYGQPLVHCYLLHAEWLAYRKHETEAADSIQDELIQAALKAAGDAQQHLVAMLQPRAARPGAVAAMVPGSVPVPSGKVAMK
jgi:hypothetical protein